MVPADLDRPAIRTARDAANLLKPLLSEGKSGSLAIAFVDERRRLVALAGGAEVEPGQPGLPIRSILAEALRLGASGLILAQARSGNPAPTEADRAAIRLLTTAAAQIEIRLHDHLIFAGGECRSMRGLGLV